MYFTALSEEYPQCVLCSRFPPPCESMAVRNDYLCCRSGLFAISRHCHGARPPARPRNHHLRHGRRGGYAGYAAAGPTTTLPSMPPPCAAGPGRAGPGRAGPGRPSVSPAGVVDVDAAAVVEVVVSAADVVEAVVAGAVDEEVSSLERGRCQALACRLQEVGERFARERERGRTRSRGRHGPVTRASHVGIVTRA